MTERTDGAERLRNIRGGEYLAADSYIAFAAERIRSGGALVRLMGALGRIRRYTLIATVLKVAGRAVALLERSALLLLIACAALALLPIAVVALVSWSAYGFFTIIRYRREISAWLSGAEEVSVYVTAGSFYGLGARQRGKHRFVSREARRRAAGKSDGACRECELPLFARVAMLEAAKDRHAVMVVCGEGLGGVRWLGHDLLAVRLNCFYLLKRRYLDRKRVTYVILS